MFDYMLFTVLIATLIIIIWAVFGRKSKAGKSIILMGSCEAGKTNLLYSLIFEDEESNDVKTVTSMVENVEQYVTSNRGIVQIVDIPGHARLRQNVFNQHKGAARAVVFVVDSATVLDTIRDVAEILFSILSDEAIRKRGCPVLVLCHKEDLDMAREPAVIREALEAEINVLRETSGSRLASLEGEARSSGAVIGRPGEAFCMSHAQNPVSFLSSSCVADGGLDAFENWLDEL